MLFSKIQKYSKEKEMNKKKKNPIIVFSLSQSIIFVIFIIQ